MVGALLLRGMLAGVVAGIFCFGFFKIVGEPPLERAIGYEARHESAAPMHGTAAPQQTEPELVSRTTQAGIGLFTGVVVYSAAFGGLFALAFALAYGRIGELGVRATAAVLAAVGFVAVHVVPALKYPANPPAIGDAATIAMRTALYFSLIAISLAAAIAAGMLRARLQRRFGGWNAMLAAAAAYLAVMTAVGLALPSIDEVPPDFPAAVLWQFRVASLGGQLMLWAIAGLLFGALTERAGRIGLRAKAA